MGIIAALGGATSMALGTVLTKTWQPPVSPLTFTAWQLTARGILLLPAALLFEPSLPPLSTANVLGFVYLGLVGGAITYILWFRGIALLGPSAVSPLGRLSPVAAVLLGWFLLNQTLTPLKSSACSSRLPARGSGRSLNRRRRWSLNHRSGLRLRRARVRKSNLLHGLPSSHLNLDHPSGIGCEETLDLNHAVVGAPPGRVHDRKVIAAPAME